MKFYSVTVDEGRRKKFARPLNISGLTHNQKNCSMCKREWGIHNLEENASFVLTNDHFADITSFLFYNFFSENAQKILVQSQIKLCS